MPGLSRSRCPAPVRLFVERVFSLVILTALILALAPTKSLGAPSAPPSQAMLIQDTPNPETVSIPGTIQSKLGCSGDWQPDCEKTFLVYDAEDDVWQGSFDLPAGDYEYKVALNKSWAENYGLKATRDGPNIPLSLATAKSVKFYYDHKTHWVTDNHNSLIITAVGNFQSKLGCSRDGDPGCLRSWLQDPDADGNYTFITQNIPAGSYEVKVAINESMDESYGEGGAKNGPAIPFTVKSDGDEIYFGYDPGNHILTVSTEGAPRGNIGAARAHWVTLDAILWQVIGSPKYTYFLYYAPEGGLKLGTAGITGGAELSLSFEKAGPGGDVFTRFPHLIGYSTLKLNSQDIDKVPEILKGQVAVLARDQDGKVVDATGVQIPGVLDDLYTYRGPLGVSYAGNVPALRVWAPTAKSVSLHLFADSTTPVSTTVPMDLDASSGVWSAIGDPGWTNQFYLYEVEVFVRSTGKVERNLVTDPYSFSLSTNSLRSQVVDLDDPSLKPGGWAELKKPPLLAPEDSVIYELHVRDFSVNDQTVPEAHRGTYLAFTDHVSNGMRHLQALARAGLTHIHLLPAFDFASVNEDKSTWESVDPQLLRTLPPDSDQQQAAVALIKDKDGFNWGYDPYHFTVPEGSYATNPDGSTRILEFREMVQALNQAGLRLVMDVVYNHTTASGQDAKSVLDKIVPGYYHRLKDNGDVETSTCCQNTASEHAMMEKLMIDSVLTWATEYKVDGFRFDLMGHHTLSNMQNVRAALDALTPEKDGVDGSQIYVYGEGWDFGEVANNARGVNASQLNIGGTGIGVFNDRLRDAARGGGPFSGLQEQGFLTGLFVDPNTTGQGSPQDQKTRLLHQMDWIRIGLAGNLRDYELVSAAGNRVTGERIDYNGKHAGYTLDPQENINYVSAHDNETLFDAIQLKAAEDASLADRVRMQNLGISLVMLGQGVPFFHAGEDMLRSKSMDRNSYDSGDWFNALDFTYQSNNWGIGLPPAGENKANWPVMETLLSEARLKPLEVNIRASVSHFQEMLAIRKSSSLFRLRTARDIEERLSFLNTGPDQIPGLLVMVLNDVPTDRRDERYGHIAVLFNVTPDRQVFKDISFVGVDYELHPVQAVSNDSFLKQALFDRETGTFSVPARTTAVFVVEEAIQPSSTVVPAQRPASTVTQPPPTSLVNPAGTQVFAIEKPVRKGMRGPSVLAPVLAGIAALAVLVGIFYSWRRRG